MKAPNLKSQAPTLAERAKAVLTPIPTGETQSEILCRPQLLRQFSTEAFILSRLATDKGEPTIANAFMNYARAMGKSARLIEDLAKEQLRRSRSGNRKSQIGNRKSKR